MAGKEEGVIIFLVFYFHPLANIHLVYRDFYHFFLINLFVIITSLIADVTCSSKRFTFYLHFHWCNWVGLIDFDIPKWHCEDLSSHQTITLLLQCKRLNELTLTSLTTIVYLSHLRNPTPSHHLSSVSLPKCIRNERCFNFLLEIERRITKAFSQCWDRKLYSYLYQYKTSVPEGNWLQTLSMKPQNVWIQLETATK